MSETEPDDLDLFVIDDTRYETFLTTKFENRKRWEPKDPRKVAAFIPGVIPKVFVQEGQKVRRGDPLLLLEAMKMQNHVNAPLDGTVRSVFVKEGQQVPRNYILVEME